LPNEWEMLAMIDGQANLRAIATRLGRSEFDVAKVAPQPRRRHRRHLPLAGTLDSHLVRQPAVLGDYV